ncbi:hypothetical protein N7509_004953 [Penicillium cosmopolitanum]|uniref:Uncharacterized protein n=1 Tax=Penicillium cosmopolitanum TaxID=1131564 RepID=A0A9X0B9L5_9EURO|nr:uncharacterized protein N7509_004953 [Penicillium cosmopolitanum]KAJ5396840.1 hypothetical protein N7509_004953 [Penicillium cosmopolitanum]
MTVTTPLALTTTFSPPPDCFTDTWYIEYVTGEYYYTTSISNSLEGWYLSQGPTNWRTCFPSGYEATTDFYYSPGVCPSGYSIAKSSVLSIGVSSETRATCCPSSFTAQADNFLVWYSTNRCFSADTKMDHVWTFTQGGTVTSMTTSGGLNAKAVFIRWQETDLQTPATTTATTTTGSTDTTTDSTATSTGLSSGPSATAATATAAAAADQSSNSSQGGSSRAWIAGPVIGAAVACALIALVATWYNRRRWQQKNSTRSYYSPQGPHRMAELYQEPKLAEAPSEAIYPGPIELPATHHR